MREKQFIIWTGAVLLLAMLATAYVAVDMIYNAAEAPYLPEEYVQTVLLPAGSGGTAQS